MKKRILLFLLLASVCLFSACSKQTADTGLTVVAVSFPEYDWARQILGDIPGVSVRLLIDDGTEKHSFQPTVGDVVSVLNCDLLIYGGGESDEWLEDILSENNHEHTAVLKLYDALEGHLIEAKFSEGMQIREAEEEEDEHFWLSIRNAQICCDAITEMLCTIDAEHDSAYRGNNAAYQLSLKQLDELYMQIVNTSPKHTLLICDRFPLAYLTEDYRLNYYAAFPGCSSETGAGFSTIIFLAERLKELELSSILVLEGTDTRVADIVAQSSGLQNVQILSFDSMQTVSIEKAMQSDYVQIMTANSNVLKQALQ